MTLDWQLTRDPPPADAAAVSDGVLRHGRAQARDGGARPLACFVREAGTLLGGAVGRTEYRRLFVQSLWVREDRRAQGLGRALLARLELAAAAQGCRSAAIETLDDRVAGLYRRLGYEPVAVVEGWVGPFNRHLLLKPLAEGGAAVPD